MGIDDISSAGTGRPRFSSPGRLPPTWRWRWPSVARSRAWSCTCQSRRWHRTRPPRSSGVSARRMARPRRAQAPPGAAAAAGCTCSARGTQTRRCCPGMPSTASGNGTPCCRRPDVPVRCHHRTMSPGAGGARRPLHSRHPCRRGRPSGSAPCACGAAGRSTAAHGTLPAGLKAATRPAAASTPRRSGRAGRPGPRRLPAAPPWPSRRVPGASPAGATRTSAVPRTCTKRAHGRPCQCQPYAKSSKRPSHPQLASMNPFMAPT